MNLIKIQDQRLVLIAIVMAVLIASAPIGAATTVLNVPLTLVNVIVQGGTDSYFLTTLSNVPDGYDVANNTYFGWCIDHSVNMTRSETFEAQLYSSLAPPPGNWFTARWDMVNYVLNHKQGNYNETQNTIWYFINNTINYNHTLNSVENATVEDALANGTGFVPSPGQPVAAIVLPQVIVPGSGPFQDSIIEVVTPTIPEFPTIVGPLLFVMAILAVAIIYARKRSETKLNAPRLLKNR